MGITIDYEKGIKADDTATVRQSLVEAWQEVLTLRLKAQRGK